MTKHQAGSLIAIRFQTYSAANPPALYTPTAVTQITLIDPVGTEVVTLASVTTESTGVHLYKWQSSVNNQLGNYAMRIKTDDAIWGTHYEPATLAFVLVNEDGSTPPAVGALVGTNADFLLGGTWASPGSIGATTPNAGAFTTLASTIFNTNDFYVNCTTNAAVDTAAMQAALTAASGVIGGTIHVKGACWIQSPGLTYDGLNNTLTIAGPSGARVGIPTKLLYKGTATAITGNTTNTSAIVTNIPSTAGLVAGWGISGAGIPASTKILSVDSGTQVTMTANATATAAGVAIKVAASLFTGKPSGLTLRNIGLQYDHAGYTGILLDLAGTSATPVSRLTIDHCYLGGIGAAYGAAVILDLRNTYDVELTANTWNNAARYIQGPESTADFANRVAILFNHFQSVCSDIYIRAGGQSWTIDQNSVEPMSAAGPTFDVPPYTRVGFVQITPAGVLGYHEGTNWLGVEGGAATGTYFVGGATGVEGGVFSSNAQIGFAAGINAWHLGASKGLLIAEYLASTSLIDFGTSSDIVLFGTRTTAITGRPTGVSLWSDSVRWNVSAPLWVDGDATTGIAYKAFGRPSDGAVTFGMYANDRTTQLGFITASTTGMAFGTTGTQFSIRADGGSTWAAGQRLGIGGAAHAARTLYVYGPSGDYAVGVDNSASAAGSSFGLFIAAGGNASDVSFNILSRTSADYFKIRGDGLLLIGGVAAVNCGSGTFVAATAVVTNGIITHC